MNFSQILAATKTSSNLILFISFLFLLLGSFILSIKTKFIQIRTLPKIFKLLFQNLTNSSTTIIRKKTISPQKALFTAMSTSIGIGNIVSPVVAIKLGGPGALLGFILAAIFGGASTFTEVALAIKHRKLQKTGQINGGPMEYLSDSFGKIWGKIYAGAGLILFVAWSAKQSNTLADLLQPYRIPEVFTGLILTFFVGFFLIAGIKQIGNLSAKLVPTMFFLYTFSSSWIILQNLDKIPTIIKLIFTSAFTPQAIAGATTGYGLLQAMRWGLGNGFYANEAGIGTATIPHSMSQTTNATEQGLLAIISVYTNGFLCLLSGFVVLLTDTWKLNNVGIGINAIIKSFSYYFPNIGIIILTFSAILFAFGTIVGNGYNGSQCFRYLFSSRNKKWYLLLLTVAVFIGTILDVESVWMLSDFFIIPVAIPNIIGIVILSFREPIIKEPHKNLHKETKQFS